MQADRWRQHQDVLGDTVLHVAAANGHVDILKAYLERYPFVLHWVNSRGMTPLHVAAMKGEHDAAQWLVEADSDLDAPDLEGNTPLHFAASWGHVPIVKLLVERGCDYGLRNADGFSAAEFAYSFGVLKDLETLIRQRAEQAKAETRAARRSKSRSHSQTLRAKRTGSGSILSIALPSTASTKPDDNGEPSAASSSVASPESAYGLGFTQLATANGVPRLAAPIPPTPVGGAAVSLWQQTPLVLPETPSEPRTPNSLYPNTTSPQASPLPSPASHGSRPSTPKLSPTIFRRFSSRASRASSTSGVSLAPSAAMSSPGRTSASNVAPSPASGYTTTSYTSPESAQTATPTPASPTPAPAQRASVQDWRSELLHSPGSAHSSGQTGASSDYLAEQEVAPQVSPTAQLSARTPAPAAPIPMVSPPSQRPLSSLSSPSSPPAGSAQGGRDSHPPTSTPPHHNKLVRKSRSHAHTPSLAFAAQAHASGPLSQIADPAESTATVPFGPLGGAGNGGLRSVSGPPLGRPSTDWQTTSSARSSFDVAEAVVDDLRERETREKSEGHKLRKEHTAPRDRTASVAADGGAPGSQAGAEKGHHHHHGGRLARVLGLRK